jgi:hypothetical protein
MTITLFKETSGYRFALRRALRPALQSDIDAIVLHGPVPTSEAWLIASNKKAPILIIR